MRRRVYAIGDMHGRLDLFEAALRAISAHDRGAEARIVCLGDYVDRGPDSARLIDRLMALERPDFICLKGNHEEMMVEALRGFGRWDLDHWRVNGGEETLESYGGIAAAPDAHLDWMNGLAHSWSDPNRDYVHAGVEPGVPMASQNPEALLWIREKFLLAPARALPRHIVHGHTPRWRGKPDAAVPEVLPHRTNLDTGAWMTGVLSVGVFDPDRPGGALEVMSIR